MMPKSISFGPQNEAADEFVHSFERSHQDQVFALTAVAALYRLQKLTSGEKEELLTVNDLRGPHKSLNYTMQDVQKAAAYLKGHTEEERRDLEKVKRKWAGVRVVTFGGHELHV